MSNHPYNQHREHQVGHRRVDKLLKDHPPGATQHAQGHAYSKITSKSAAVRDDDIKGARVKAGKYARGGKVKGGTTVNIVIPGGGAPKPPLPLPGPMAGPPPGGPPMGPPPGGPPPMMGPPPGGPPGMPMRANGGRISKGTITSSPASANLNKAQIKQMAARARANSFIGKQSGGAITGIGRLEKAGKK